MNSAFRKTMGSLFVLMAACQSHAGQTDRLHVIRGTVSGVTVVDEVNDALISDVGTVPQILDITVSDAYPPLPGDLKVIQARFDAPTQRAVSDTPYLLILEIRDSVFTVKEFAESLSVSCFEIRSELIDGFYDDDDASLGSVLGRENCYVSDQ